MTQEVKSIPIKDLVLWTENPRDPIDADATDQDIVNKALDDKLSKWTLPQLAKDMGPYYDYSELPTVVYHDGKPVVYDGNRRIILGKIKLGYVSIGDHHLIDIPFFQQEIPCNVCDEKTALNNVNRKHIDSGSWDPLERDIFLHKFMADPKSPYLVLEEETRIISQNPHLNKRFVKEEIFREDILNTLGFQIKDGRLYTVHSDKEAEDILSDISLKIEKKKISTRNNRGKVIEILDPESQRLIKQNKENQAHLSNINLHPPQNDKNQRQSKRTSKKESEIFGGRLFLKSGDVSNLHRDIVDLYNFYLDNKSTLSNSFPALIRMALRLLIETASKDADKKLDTYLKAHFETAKKSLDQDAKTTLANQSVNATTITQLLQTGAHSYTSSTNLHQTIAISIILGAILTITHGRQE